jgi:conjugal transfer pilus assembly protein TraK
MEVVAKHGVPNGYSVIDMDIPTIAMNGLIVETLKKFSNRNSDIYLYRVTNPGPAGANLSEQEFDGDLVQAVSIYPKPHVAVGQSVEVMVLAAKRRAMSNSSAQ